MGRTRRSRKREQRAQKRVERQLEEHRKAGAPVTMLMVGSPTKTRKPEVHLGQKISAERLTKRARLFAFLRAKP